MKIVTKTKMMGGFQCTRLLYYQVHRPRWARATTIGEQLLFDQGHLVGAEARKRFPGGRLISSLAWEYDKAVLETKNALEGSQTTLFEAAFQNGPLFVRVDVLEWTPDGWNIIEVKSALSVKEEYLQDCAIQYVVLKGLGVPINKISLMHINRDCMAPDLTNLFITQDVTESIKARAPAVKARIIEFLEVLKVDRPPEIMAGLHCSHPYDCRFQEKCWSEMLMPKISLLDLPGIKSEKKWELFHAGKTLENLSSEDLEPITQRALECHRTGEPFIDKAAIGHEIQQWSRPLWFLDFETIGFAVPRFIGTKPFEQIPFQYSLHVQSERHGPLRHEEFLDLSGNDPRERLATKLLSDIGPEGDIVAYHAAFEKRVISDLAFALPQYREKLNNLLTRFRDPLPLLRQAVYFKEFNGSFSLKSVGPALLGAEYSYEGLKIQDGSNAQAAYLTYLSSPQEEIRNALREYCTQDTLVLVKLTDKLFDLSEVGGVQQRLF